MNELKLISIILLFCNQTPCAVKAEQQLYSPGRVIITTPVGEWHCKNIGKDNCEWRQTGKKL